MSTINAALYDAETGRIVQLTIGDADNVARSAAALGLAVARVAPDALRARFFGLTHHVVDGEVQERPDAEAQADIFPILLGDIRARRDRMLAESDWTQMRTDWPEAQRDAWAAYRQALRDLTEGLDDPRTVKWPLPPA